MASNPTTWIAEWAVLPGEILVEILAERSMSQAELARRMARPLKTISEIANGKAAITPDTALQLERALGVSASFWNGAEIRYREGMARQRALEELKQYSDWVAQFPLAQMAGLGLVPGGSMTEERAASLLAFFEVSSPSGWEQQWGRSTAALRGSQTHASSPHALAAWLRWGEIEAGKLNPDRYVEDAFLEALGLVRRLSRMSAFEIVLETLRSTLASTGVALVVLPELPGTRVSGAARWLRSGVPLIQLSLRHLSDDQFWFSLYHEAGHILHRNRRSDFVDDLDGADEPEVASDEAAANSFARDTLIPPDKLEGFLGARDFSAAAVSDFARENEIAAGIVVGRLQRDRHIAPSRLNHLKRRYEVIVTADAANAESS